MRDSGNFVAMPNSSYDSFHMALTSLLVCADAESVQILTHALQDLGVEVEPCGDASLARTRIDAQPFDAVLLDCQNEPAAIELILHLRRKLGTHGTVIAIADGDNQVREILRSGADFVLYKPISRERAEHSIRAARGLMQEERRGYPRIPVQTPASIAYTGKEDVPSSLQDLSEEGARFQADTSLPPCCKVYFEFSLPGRPAVIRLSGEMMWQDAANRAGLRFAHVPQTSRRILKEWLQSRVEQPPLTQEAQTSAATQTRPEGRELSLGLGMLSAASADRREPSRQPCLLGAEVYRAAGGAPNRCTLIDIGAGGCYVEAAETIPPDTPVELVVRTHDLKLCISGKVKSSNPGFGMGIEFALRNDEQRRQLQRLIAGARQQSESSRQD